VAQITQYDLRVSDNGRFFQHEDGKPFFWLADTAWELFHRLDRTELHTYLATRGQQGFNVVQAVLLAEMDGVNSPNREGQLPLIDRDPARPDLRKGGYWDLVDHAVDEAAKHGLYMALLPTWGDKVNKDWGTGPVIFDEANARAYGRFLGERYGHRPNVLWVNGGDRDPKDRKDVYRAIAQGLRETEKPKRLMTFHPMGGRSSSADFHEEAWLDFNMMQSGHGFYGIRCDQMIDKDYARLPTKPVLDGEPNYENHRPFDNMPKYPHFRAFDVRRASYWSVFAGGCGITYGCHAVWQMASPLFPPVNHPMGTWRHSLALPGAVQLEHLKRLMLSRPYFSRIPDQTLVLDQPEPSEFAIRATRDAQGTYALIYFPAPYPTRIAVDRLRGPLRGWWYDPRTGASTEIADPGITFDPPTAEDWVLVLDSRAAGYAEPGLS
jgi:hypothetical protein